MKGSFKGDSKPTTTTKFNSTQRVSGRERQSLYIQEETHKTKLYADQLIGNESGKDCLRMQIEIIIFVYGLVTKKSFYLLKEMVNERETDRVRKRGDKETNRYYTIKKTIKYILIYTEKRKKCFQPKNENCVTLR